MVTIELKIPKKYDSFLSDDSELQSVITEFMFDYIEWKQDMNTRNNLINSEKFHFLNNSIEQRLWEL